MEKKQLQVFFFSQTVRATATTFGGEVHSRVQNYLRKGYTIRPHGGAITAHFTFRPITLEP